MLGSKLQSFLENGHRGSGGLHEFHVHEEETPKTVPLQEFWSYKTAQPSTVPLVIGVIGVAAYSTRMDVEA